MDETVDYAACHSRMREALARCRAPTPYAPAPVDYRYPTDAHGRIQGIMSPIDADDFAAGRWGPAPR